MDFFLVYRIPGGDTIQSFPGGKKRARGGEAAALLYTAGFGLVLNDFFTALHSSSATLTVALYVYANERGETAVAFSIATILMLLTLLINLSAVFLGRKLKKN